MAIHKLSSLVVGFLLLIHGIHSIPTPDGKSVSIPIPPSNMGTTIYQLPANFDYSPYMKSSKLNSRAARDSFVTVPLSVITQSSVMTITPGKNHKISQICQTRETSGTVVDAQTLMRQFSNRGSDLCCQTNGAQPMHHLTHYNTSIVPFYNHTKGKHVGYCVSCNWIGQAISRLIGVCEGVNLEDGFEHSKFYHNLIGRVQGEIRVDPEYLNLVVWNPDHTGPRGTPLDKFRAPK